MGSSPPRGLLDAEATRLDPVLFGLTALVCVLLGAGVFDDQQSLRVVRGTLDGTVPGVARADTFEGPLAVVVLLAALPQGLDPGPGSVPRVRDVAQLLLANPYIIGAYFRPRIALCPTV